MSVYVKKIQFKLHESYTNSNRVVTKPPYEVTETGWGEFEVVIKIFFNDPNERPVSIMLNPPIAEATFVQSTRTQKIYENSLNPIMLV